MAISAIAHKRNSSLPKSLPLLYAMHVLLTVGSTHFDELVNECISKSVLDVLRRRGVSSFSIQCGKYDIESRLGKNADGVWRLQDAGIQMEIWRYKPTLSKEYNRADLVISHAGVFLTKWF